MCSLFVYLSTYLVIADANYALTLQDEELARRLAEDEQRAAHQAVWMEERDRQMAVHLQSAEVLSIDLVFFYI